MKKAKFHIIKRGLNKSIVEQVQGYTDFITDGDFIHEIGYHKPNSYEWSATHIATGLLIVTGKSRAECRKKVQEYARRITQQLQSPHNKMYAEILQEVKNRTA